jgi:hypothetical protein
MALEFDEFLYEKLHTIFFERVTFLVDDIHVFDVARIVGVQVVKSLLVLGFGDFAFFLVLFDFVFELFLLFYGHGLVAL